MNETETAEWVKRITDAKAEADRAQAAFEEVVRDAHAAGMAENAIAKKGLGTQSRVRVRAILGKGAGGDAPVAPPFVPVALVTGAKAHLDREIGRELHARGWLSVGREEAWHLARGGVPVVSCGIVYESGAARIAQVRAVYRGGEQAWQGPERLVPVDRWFADRPRHDGGRGERGIDPVAVARAITQTL